MSVLVVTGVAREARIAAGPGVETVCSGGSPARLRSLLAGEPGSNVTSVVSFGVAGGLDPALLPGDIVVVSSVASEAGSWPADKSLVSGLEQALAGLAGVRVVVAALAGLDVALVDPAAKADLRARTGAAAVDMESHIAAEYAARHGLPFAAVRVVCDPARHGLPPLVASALKPDGSVALAAVLGSLARRPGQIVDLVRLGREASIAFRSLSRVPDRWAAVFR